MTTPHDAARHQLAEDFKAARKAYEAAIESPKPHMARMTAIHAELRRHDTPVAHMLANECEKLLANRSIIEPTPEQFHDGKNWARDRFGELAEAFEATA